MENTTGDVEQRVAVIGALGFIGSHLAERLANMGARVCAIDNEWFNGRALGEAELVEVQRRKAALTRAFGRTDSRLVKLDANDKTGLLAVLGDFSPTHVVHLAACSSVDVTRGDPFAAYLGNVTLTATLLDVLRDLARPLRLVYVSSSMVYGNFLVEAPGEAHPCRPLEAYGASKLACEELVTVAGRIVAGLETVIVRPSAVYGPGDFNGRVTERFAKQAAAGQVLTLNNGGEGKLDFTYVDDLVEGLVLATLRREACGGIFNITCGRGRSLNELALCFKRYLPNLEFVVGDARSDRPRRGGLDITQARRHLGYEPSVALEEGIRRLLNIPDEISGPVPCPPRPVAQARPLIMQAEVDAVAASLQQPWLSAGPETARFEEACARFLGCPETLALNSGVSALILALMANDIRGEVLLPAYTFPAVANAVVLAGATPVFVDIEPDTFGMSPVAATEKISARTEAIIAVHAGGVPCLIEDLCRLATAKGLLLIEDVAQAMGASCGGRPVGGFGQAAAFSFFPSKIITTGEGGLLVLRDATRLERARRLAAHGIQRPSGNMPSWQRRLAEPGYNFRLAASAAALGRVQLTRVPEFIARRTAIAARYTKALDASGFRPQRVRAQDAAVYQLYLTRLPGHIQRDGFLAELDRRGIGASVHYDLPLPFEAPFSGTGAPGHYPCAEQICRDIVSLPMHAALADADVTSVIEAVVELAGDRLHV